jgi:hypothetical protein
MPSLSSPTDLSDRPPWGRAEEWCGQPCDRTDWQRGPTPDGERAPGLERPLAEDFPGAAELRVQAGSARVTGKCRCGCPTVHLSVDEAAPLASVLSRIPGEAQVDNAPGHGLILFVDERRMSLLEFYTSNDSPPAQFPGRDASRRRGNPDQTAPMSRSRADPIRSMCG